MIRRALHRWVLATRRLPGLRALYRGIYSMAVASAARFLRALPGVSGIVLHRGMTGRSWEPGVSDIDLILVRRPCPEGGEASWLRRLARRLDALRLVFPMLGDLWIGEEAEVADYLRWGGLRAWEDPPRWRWLGGRGAAAPALAESLEKRRRLDPWVWAFVSHMEISRRFLRPGPQAPEKAAAEIRKLYVDFRRYADFAAGEDLAARPRTREEAARDLPEAGKMDARRLWLDSASRLAEASKVVLGRVASARRARAVFPAARPGEDSRPLRELLAAVKAAAGVVVDAPYHTYLLLAEGSAPSDYESAARALSASPVPGVPLALEPAAWALVLQSSYLGAPLGWLGWDGDCPAAQGEGLFAGWGPRAAGTTESLLPLLPEGLRWEAAAEAASWMALWWRYLWIAPGWPSRFVLYHLYTRALGLRLALAGTPSGPFSLESRLLERCAGRFPADASFLESAGRFFRHEPAACVDDLARSSLAPEHLEALSALVGSFSAYLGQGQPACSPR